MSEDKKETIMCADCGTRPMDKYSSGTPECWRCWYRRKLDLPAASYWAREMPEYIKASDKLMGQFDMWDWMHFLPACGLSKEEIVEFVDALSKAKAIGERIRAYSQLMVDTGYGDMPNEEELSKKRDKEGDENDGE